MLFLFGGAVIILQQNGELKQEMVSVNPRGVLRDDGQRQGRGGG